MDRSWGEPARVALPEEGEAQVWRARLDVEAACRERFWNSLSAGERERAGRFRFARDRDRFVTARGLLRALLARYLECAPESLRFQYGPRGKPALQAPAPLCFNLSHSGNLALYAVTRGRKVGVDVERIQPQFVRESIAERFFSPREVADLRTLPPDQQIEAFFRCWTRKEAFLKATGEGVSRPLDSFDVTLLPQDPPLLLATRPDASEAACWSLTHLETGADSLGALAMEGPCRRLTCYQLPSGW